MCRAQTHSIRFWSATTWGAISNMQRGFETDSWLLLDRKCSLVFASGIREVSVREPARTGQRAMGQGLTAEISMPADGCFTLGIAFGNSLHQSATNLFSR